MNMHCIAVCHDLQKMLKTNKLSSLGSSPVMKVGFYSYDPDTKQHSLRWKSTQWPRLKKQQQIQSATNCIMFLNIRALVIKNSFLLVLVWILTFIVIFWDTLEELCDKKRSELWKKQNLLLHHDNTPAYTSLKTMQFLTENNMISHPTFSQLSPLLLCLVVPKWNWSWKAATLIL